MITMQDLEAFVLNLPRDEQVILKRLRSLILDAEPRIREKLSYGVPYFSRHKRLFFLWPASAISNCAEKKTTPPKVTLGFCHVDLISNAQGLLNKEGRTHVCTIKFSSLADIDDRLISECLNEAILVDEQFRKNKK